MDKITEVGQKMRSAIKAKLIELGCYVDDELPDYIMVMVANHRSKDMMTEDLQLFLNENTEVFVNWLHQVLKKLQEVTVTNIDIPKIAKQEARLKRKIVESKSSKAHIKKEKNVTLKIKKPKLEKETPKKSISDEIPVTAKTIVERRISFNPSNTMNIAKRKIYQVSDRFDIPSMSEVDNLELAEIETKIEAAKKKLASLENDIDDGDFINIKADEELFEKEFADETNPGRLLCTNKNLSNLESTVIVPSGPSTNPVPEQGIKTPPLNLNQPKTTIIKLCSEPTSSINTPKVNKVSILDRLGTRSAENKTDFSNPMRKKIRLSDIRRGEEELINNSWGKSQESNKLEKVKPRVSVHDRIGIMSTVINVPKVQKRSSSPNVTPPRVNTSVSSVVQIKPRKLIPKNGQANKNLLLKAVAEAQKSVCALDSHKEKMNNNISESRLQQKRGLFTRRYRKNEMKYKDQIKNILIKVCSESADQTAPKKDMIVMAEKTRKLSISPTINFKPSSLSNSIEQCDTDDDMAIESLDPSTKHEQRFIVTLTGIDDSIFTKNPVEIKSNPKSIKVSEQLNTETPKVPAIVKCDSTTEKNEEKILENTKPKMVRRNPSPIIFDKTDIDNTKVIHPEPRIARNYPSLPLKIKERCKYWPTCRLGDECEFMHPTLPCKLFPMCKFGDRCLYVHPVCKFDVSCSRRGCPFTHAHSFPKPIKIPATPLIASTIVPVVHPSASSVDPPQQTCKYFPNCTNLQCTFYHPKVCRFGKYCNNKLQCNFCHKEVPTKEKLKWRPA